MSNKLLEIFKAPGKSRVYDFFEIIDKTELEKAFRRWVRTFIDIPEHSVAAVDGKVLRGSANAKDNAVSVLSAVLAETDSAESFLQKILQEWSVETCAVSEARKYSWGTLL